MSATIFISYASRDRKVADSVCNALENRGLKCWISSRDIVGGENFQEAIVRAIRGAKVMLLIFSANANNSDELKKELVVAGHCKLVVVPLRVEDVTPNDAFSYELATRQWIDMFDDWERALDRLVSHLTAILGSVAPVEAAAPTAAPAAPTPAPPAPSPPAPPPPMPQTKAAPPAEDAPKDPVKPAAARPEVAALAQPQTLTKKIPTPLIVLGAGLALLLLSWVGWMLYRGSEPATPPNVAATPSTPATPAPAQRPAPNPAPTPSPPAKTAPTPSPSPSILPAEAIRRGQTAENQKNYPEALRWYRQAADQGYASGQNHVGYFFDRGLGVDQDYAEAMRWYRKAADQGDPLGQTNVGVLLQNGWGVNQDYADALRWYRKAADQGFAPAEYRIGLMYDSGTGVSKNPVLARAWMVEASGNGSEDAKKWLASHN